MSVNDTFGLVVRGTVTGQDHIHTLHFRAGMPDVGAEELIDAWRSACLPTYRAMFSTADQPVSVVRALKVCGSLPLDAPVEEAGAAGTTAGLRAVGSLPSPSFLAAVAIERGALAGRSRSGRFFISGSYLGDMNTNVWQGAYMSILNAYATALTSEFITEDVGVPWQLVTHSRKLAQPGVACNVSSTLVKSVTFSTAVTTMRSRKVGHGS